MLPLKIVLTEAKYDPMGMMIMAKVKANSLMMTSLESERFIRNGTFHFWQPVEDEKHGEVWQAYAGTAGAMFDCWLAAGLAPTASSFSRIVFSDDMILREDILRGSGCV